MTKERKEQLSNRLVLNFGVLLFGALLMLYVNSSIKSIYSEIAYIVILVLGILGALSAVLLFVLGKKKNLKLKNYSVVGVFVFASSALIYLSKLNLYSKNFAVITVYILMLVYFVVLAVCTGILLNKPVVKDIAAIEKAKAIKKNKKKRKK